MARSPISPYMAESSTNMCSIRPLVDNDFKSTLSLLVRISKPVASRRKRLAPPSGADTSAPPSHLRPYGRKVSFEGQKIGKSNDEIISHTSSKYITLQKAHTQSPTPRIYIKREVSVFNHHHPSTSNVFKKASFLDLYNSSTAQ